MTGPLTQAAIMERAALAAGLVDYWGARGATLVSCDQIEAMALALVILGLRPILPPSASAGAPVAPMPAPLTGGVGVPLPILVPADA